jgi:hypothetical protein
VVRAQVRFELARALRATHGDATRALELAKTARAELAPVTEHRDLLQQIDEWVAHSSSPR